MIPKNKLNFRYENYNVWHETCLFGLKTEEGLQKKKIGGLEYTAIESTQNETVCEDYEKSECIISKLEDNFEWTITCVTGI